MRSSAVQHRRCGGRDRSSTIASRVPAVRRTSAPKRRRQRDVGLGLDEVARQRGEERAGFARRDDDRLGGDGGLAGDDLDAVARDTNLLHRRPIEHRGAAHGCRARQTQRRAQRVERGVPVRSDAADAVDAGGLQQRLAGQPRRVEARALERRPVPAEGAWPPRRYGRRRPRRRVADCSGSSGAAASPVRRATRGACPATARARREGRAPFRDRGSRPPARPAAARRPAPSPRPPSGPPRPAPRGGRRRPARTRWRIR